MNSARTSPLLNIPMLLLLFGCSSVAWPFRAEAERMPSPEDWRDINIYQIFTDRFFDGDPSNNFLSPSTYNPTHSRRIHGGDFRGIERKLDYIRALGANAIWISPIPLNVGHSAYHGYGAHDFYTLSPQWGSMDDLKSMTAAAHARGMYVILDIVCNHMGDRIGSSDPGYPQWNPSGYNLRWWTNVRYPAPFNSLDHFHNFGDISGNWFDPPQILGELLALDDLKTETDYVRNHMVDIYRYWIEQGDFDGFRIDTVKHVEMGFWQHFNPAIRDYAATLGKSNFFQFGEVYDGSDAKVGSYTGTQGGGAYANDSVLDFPLYFRVNAAFARATAPTVTIQSRYQTLQTHYHPDARDRLVTFLDNHDFPRFMSAANANNNTSRLHVATTFLYTARGIPSLYYGTEQNFNGGNDPNNREDMFDGQFPASGPSVGDRFDMTEATFRHIARLNNLRRLYPALRRGTHHNLWNNPSAPGLFAYARRLGTQEVFVVMNTSDIAQTLPARPTIHLPGTVLVNLFDTNETLTVTGPIDGIPPVFLPGASAKLFLAASQWQPLDPVVERQLPLHDASGVAWHGGVTLAFSEGMEPETVEAGFQIDPPLSGSFLWNAANTRMTFLPDEPGFASNQRYHVRVNDAAASGETGQHLHGAFETRFRIQPFAGAPVPPADGIPHWFRTHYFDTTEASAALKTRAEDDFDGDGVSNADEFAALTDPTDAQSFLRILGGVESGSVRLEYATANARWYRILYTDGLAEEPQSWLPLTSWQEGDGAGRTDLDPTPGAQRAYRLELRTAQPE